MMYIEYEMQLGEEGEITLKCDTSSSPFGFSLRLSNGNQQVIISKIEAHTLAQFVVNTKRIVRIAHEDDMLSNDSDDDIGDIDERERQA